MAASVRDPESRGARERYRCFLVRCRLEAGAEPAGKAGRGDEIGRRAPAWRFTVLQVGGDPARRSFTSLSDVAAYLETELKSCDPSAADNLIRSQRRIP